MTLRLALRQHAVLRHADLTAWATWLDRTIAEAAGADLLVLPEYGLLDAIGGPHADVVAEREFAADLAPRLIAVARGAAMRHGVWLLAGSLPTRTPDGVVNRATLIAADGRMATQDKRRRTRFEAETWGLIDGADPRVFETPWGILGIAICYDAEFPGLVRAQVQAGAWLVLVPTCTDTVAGFNRVSLCARARAIENQCFVAVSPTVGETPWLAALDVNRGHAAVYSPADRGFPEDGVLARGAWDEPGWVFATLDPDRLRGPREGGAVRNHADWPPASPPCSIARFA